MKHKPWIPTGRKLLVLFALMAFLGGCGEPAVPEYEGATDPTHIYEEVRDGLLIDADVVRPGDGTVPKVYTIKKPEFNQEVVDRFLAAAGDSGGEMEVSVIDNATCYTGTSRKGHGLFAFMQDTTNFVYYNFSYNNEEANNVYSTCVSYYYSEDDQSTNADRSNMELFLEPKNFAFATAQEARQAVEQALIALNFENYVLKDTLYLDHTALEAAYNSEYIQEKLAKFSEVADNSPAEIGSLTAADDAYKFTYYFAVDGIPMLYNAWSNVERFYCPAYIMVTYNADGIVSLTAEGVWTIADAEAETPAGIIPAAQAVAAAKNRLIEVITPSDQVIKRVALRYAYVQDKDRWLLTPVWEVAVQKGSIIPEHDYYSFTYILIDAINGEEI